MSNCHSFQHQPEFLITERLVTETTQGLRDEWINNWGTKKIFFLLPFFLHLPLQKTLSSQNINFFFSIIFFTSSFFMEDQIPLHTWNIFIKEFSSKNQGVNNLKCVWKEEKREFWSALIFGRQLNFSGEIEEIWNIKKEKIRYHFGTQKMRQQSDSWRTDMWQFQWFSCIIQTAMLRLLTFEKGLGPSLYWMSLPRSILTYLFLHPLFHVCIPTKGMKLNLLKHT